MSSFKRNDESPFRGPRVQTGRRLGPVAGLLIVLALLVAACGYAAEPTALPASEPTSPPVPTDTPVAEVMITPSVTVADQAAGEAAITPSVTVADQGLLGDNVTIAEVVSDGPGWLVVYAQADGKPGPILGYSPAALGANSNVAVQLDLTAATTTLYAMLHTDAGEVGIWEFPDGPDTPVKQGEAPVMAPFSLETAEGQVEVALTGFKFDPAVLVIKSGTTVTWINNDGDVRHSVESDANVWRSDLFAGGGSFSYTFNEPGVYPYHCQPHGDVGGQGMAATIIVLN